jgi:hypothetical protein
MVVGDFVALRLDSGWSKSPIDLLSAEKLATQGELTHRGDLADVANGPAPER